MPYPEELLLPLLLLLPELPEELLPELPEDELEELPEGDLLAGAIIEHSPRKKVQTFTKSSLLLHVKADHSLLCYSLARLARAA